MDTINSMSELTLTGLRVVREVARRGSFTAAADALGYTQSAVSRQVAAMEAAAGAALFERLPRGVRPTDAGDVLLRHADTVLAGADAAAQELGGLRDRLEGRLSLGAFPTALAALVPRALARLALAHPAVRVTVREGTTPAHLRRVRAGHLAVAVVAVGDGLADGVEGLRADRLLAGRLLVAVPAGDPLTRHGRVTPRALQGRTWIVGDTAGEGPDFGPWPGPADEPIGYRVRDWQARLGFVAAGLGLTVVPDMITAAMPPGVVVLPVDDPRPVRRAAVAITREDRTPEADALVAALQDAAADITAVDR